ncbi:MAG TPA: P22 phage major capsid protein family protein [Promineifilum sp.]|nr:P22 phage major capsid protein family protein [Promineifilum sp.]
MRKAHSKRAVRAIKMPAIVHLSAYANTLTRLIPDLYAGLDVVSRELVGFVPSVSRDPQTTRGAVGQAVVYAVAPSQTSIDIAPAMTIPEPRDQTIGNGNITITKSKAVEFGFTGEEQRGLNTGPGYLSVQADMFAQGLRTLTNEIENDLAVEGLLNASRAVGAPSSTPFASNLGDMAQVRKILDDNGAPPSERSFVGPTSYGAALRTLQNLTRANEAGTVMTLRDGELLNIHGFSIKESGASGLYHTAGTGASATTNAAGYAIGATVITLASAGTGEIKAGDVIQFAGDANKYVVVSGDADVSGGGTITIAAPGLRRAIPASAQNITVLASHEVGLGFSRNALHLAQRLPALPQEGDAAIDRLTIVDPRSGLPFEVALYAGYRKIRAEVAAAWGVKAVKREHIAALIG